jgi:hypothetical protein
MTFPMRLVIETMILSPFLRESWSDSYGQRRDDFVDRFRGTTLFTSALILPHLLFLCSTILARINLP